MWTGLGTAGISGVTTLLQEFTRGINARYHQVVSIILDAEGGWDFDDSNNSGEATLLKNLVADDAFVSLAATDKVLKIRRAEITYDGTNWKKMEPLNKGQSGKPFDTTSIKNQFNSAEPYYDQVGLRVYTYPRPTTAQTNGIKFWIDREIDEFATTDTTQEPGFAEPFHRMLSVGASLDWAIAKGLSNKNDLAALWSDYETRLRKWFQTQQPDRKFQFSSIYSDSTYGS